LKQKIPGSELTESWKAGKLESWLYEDDLRFARRQSFS